MRRKIWDQEGLNFLTLTVVDWTDVFSRKRYRDILIDSLRFCQEAKGLEIFAYVFMTNHIHLVARVREGEPAQLSDILRDFKRYTANQIIAEIKKSGRESRKEWLLHRFLWNAKKLGDGRKYQFWQSGNYPTALWSAEVIWQKIHYIHRNPVKAGWVEYAPHYLYSSAANYAGENGLMPVTLYAGKVYK